MNAARPPTVSRMDRTGRPIGNRKRPPLSTGWRVALTISRMEKTAMSTPSQKGMNPAPGPKVLLGGILRLPSITATEKIRTMTPVTLSARRIGRLRLLHR